MRLPVCYICVLIAAVLLLGHEVIAQGDEPNSLLEEPLTNVNDSSKNDVLTHQAVEDTSSLKEHLVSEINESPKEVCPHSASVEQTFGKIEEFTVNDTLKNATNKSQTAEEKGNTTSVIVCNTGKENGGMPVELVNSTRLISILVTESNVTDRRTSADCTLVLFYARYCPFSSMAAPHFNALPRAFPDIKLAAVDAMKHHSFNTQYGIVGVPTLMLFHNGRPAAKFNDSEYNLEAFAKFVTKYTGLQPHDKLYVTSADFGGPVSSVPTKETDYCLILSWAFMLVCGLYLFSKSSWWHWISEAVQNTWHEAEAQHEHGD